LECTLFNLSCIYPSFCVNARYLKSSNDSGLKYVCQLLRRINIGPQWPKFEKRLLYDRLVILPEVAVLVLTILRAEIRVMFRICYAKEEESVCAGHIHNLCAAGALSVRTCASAVLSSAPLLLSAQLPPSPEARRSARVFPIPDALTTMQRRSRLRIRPASLPTQTLLREEGKEWGGGHRKGSS